ncbi:hypothetical protein JMA_02710 [Jeotgalibacillus malaysiensis]|uniref:DUF7878 domain-containing protein n=1 Tax=Jeotgalibacillus malaysiensis TaxID=1508404 RepID=A0A0B5AM11_9BACL|nr:hypothetical protein JMA_02710 [Jeotgalibacillus malaysiensis]
MKFELDQTNQIEPKLLKKRNGKLLVDIQGRLDIFVNDRCFFSEPSLALLEFGVALKRWNREDHFRYFTMEHDEREGPILAFIEKEACRWSLFSIWQECDAHEPLTFEVVSGAVDTFLLELDKDLINNYGIKIDDFI